MIWVRSKVHVYQKSQLLRSGPHKPRPCNLCTTKIITSTFYQLQFFSPRTPSFIISSSSTTANVNVAAPLQMHRRATALEVVHQTLSVLSPTCASDGSCTLCRAMLTRSRGTSLLDFPRKGNRRCPLLLTLLSRHGTMHCEASKLQHGLASPCSTHGR